MSIVFQSEVSKTNFDIWAFILFLAHLAEGHVSYCHHLASVVVIVLNNFQNSSPLTLHDQLEPNLVWMFLWVSCVEMMWGFLIHRKTWPPLLKIEHMGQTVGFCIYPKLLVLAKFWHRLEYLAWWDLSVVKFSF